MALENDSLVTEFILMVLTNEPDLQVPCEVHGSYLGEFGLHHVDCFEFLDFLFFCFGFFGVFFFFCCCF